VLSTTKLVSSAVLAASVTPWMTSIGLKSLDTDVPRRMSWIAVGAIAGMCAAIGSTNVWWMLATLAWATTLAAAAICDAKVRRIPTHLLVGGGTATSALLVVAAAVTHQWSALASTAAMCLLCTVVFGARWRFGGAGFGDVRLAAFGGLGIGHASLLSITIGLAATCLLVWFTSRHALRQHERHMPLGPALVAGFLLAATV
jgi:leader peptidase (prepilin peptidase)/N-methyltransferase